MIKSVHAFLSKFKADLISHAFLGFLLHLRFEEKIILKQYNVAAHRQWIKYVSLNFFYTFRIKSLYSHLLKFFSFLFWTNTRSWLRCNADLKRRFHIWLVMPMVCARPECLNSELYFCQTISQKTSFEILFSLDFVLYILS